MAQYTLSNRDINEWTRTLNLTMPHWERKVTNETLDKRLAMNILKRHGRIRYNQTGNGVMWTPKYKVRPLNDYLSGQTITVQQRNLHQQASMADKQKEMNDLITRKEQLQNRGKDAIKNLFRDKLSDLRDDMATQFDSQFYKDGHTNTGDFNGIASFKAYTAASSMLIAGNDNYAGLSTVPGAYGRSSYADPEYHFWSPILVNDTADWGATDTWEAEADQIVSYAISKTMGNNAEDQRIDYVITTHTRYHQFDQLLRTNARIIMKGEKLTKAGFQGLIFDGAEVGWTQNCPSGYTYGINASQVWLRILSPKLIDAHVEYDVDVHGWKITALILGNFIFNSPRHFFITADMSS